MKKIMICICILVLFLCIIYPTRVQATTLDEILRTAENFLNLESGGAATNGSSETNNEELKSMSDLLYNTLLAIGMVVAVVIGLVLAIKYMLAGSEEKAEIKETIPAYIVSCIVVFGAFTIWKIIINLIQ